MNTSKQLELIFSSNLRKELFFHLYSCACDKKDTNHMAKALESKIANLSKQSSLLIEADLITKIKLGKNSFFDINKNIYKSNMYFEMFNEIKSSLLFQCNHCNRDRHIIERSKL